jgi:hypothetical protein
MLCTSLGGVGDDGRRARYEKGLMDLMGRAAGDNGPEGVVGGVCQIKARIIGWSGKAGRADEALVDSEASLVGSPTVPRTH